MARWGTTSRLEAICRRLKAVRGGISPATRRQLGREGPRRPVSGEVTARAEGPRSSAAVVGSYRARCTVFRGGEAVSTDNGGGAEVTARRAE
jgi:hypothetical protein